MKKLLAILALPLFGFAAIFGSFYAGGALFGILGAAVPALVVLILCGCAAVIACYLSGVYRRKFGMRLGGFAALCTAPTLVFSAAMVMYSEYLSRTIPPQDGVFSFGGIEQFFIALAGFFGSAVLIAALIISGGINALSKRKKA